MIQAQDLTIKLGCNIVVNRLSLTAKEGQITHICGANGSGKTTLLKGLAGLCQYHHGAITYQKAGENISNYQKNMIFMGVDEYLHDSLSLYDNLSYLLQLYGVECNQKPIELMTKWGLHNYSNNLSKELSFGQKKRLMMVLITMASQTRSFILLDEPFIGLDKVGQQLLLSLLEDLCNNGAVVLITSHNGLVKPKVAYQKLLLN